MVSNQCAQTSDEGTCGDVDISDDIEWKAVERENDQEE